MDIKIVIYEKISRKRKITEAINLLESLQNHFHYNLQYMSTELVKEKQIDWTTFCHNNENAEDYTIFITQKPFCDNFFSHEHHNFSVISTHGWEDYFAPPSLSAYILYQISQAMICFSADLSDKMEKRMNHKNITGCMFDLCEKKSDIKISMSAGYICPECRIKLHQYGVTEIAIDAVENILAYVRAESIGKPFTLKCNEAFVVMRFSKNDENDHAYEYGIKPALDNLKIKCNRGDDQILSGMILNKVNEAIQANRFIIAKVDETNLNVYYELGLAMGLKKDVLLISEESLIVNLPTDLKNWECLTYPNGNYKELKNKIIKFFCDRFNYSYK